MRRVYVDYSATTPIAGEVLAAMQPYLRESYGNASSIHSAGRDARAAVERAREQVAGLLGARQPREIVFTSGATESDNLAVRGVCYGNQDRGRHVVTSMVEHHAVLHTCQALERQGFEVTYLPVDEWGRVGVSDVRDALRDDTVLVSLILVNNEVGTLMPIGEIAAACRERGVYLHTDAVQAPGMLELSVEELGVDLLSMSGHKIYGPKGVGALYVRRGTRILPQQTGGSHERSLRAGTENVPGIVGLGEAARLAQVHRQARAQQAGRQTSRLLEGLEAAVPHLLRNGHPTERAPHILNVSILFAEGEAMLLSLDMVGICAASGSACTSGTLEPSHVLLAMGRKHEEAHGSLRFSVGIDTTDEEIEYVIQQLPPIVQRLRAMSPLYTEE